MNAYKAELQKLLRQFGQNVKRARLAQRPPCSQERLADASQLHRTEISRIEQGLVEPRLTTLMILAEALGVSVDELFDGVDAPAKRRPSPTGGGRRKPPLDGAD
jgi:transcriptional regulator with XRE-family HTH domain